MQTVDIHTHLMNPNVRFERFYDKLAVRFFAKSLGVTPAALMADPFGAYVEAMARAIRESGQVTGACLFGVDARFDESGRETDRDRTVCAMTEDVLAVTAQHPDVFIPFMSVNPRRPGALELIDEYLEKGCRGAKFLQNYWGLNLNNSRFIPYYDKLAAHGLPLIIHVGSEYSIDSDRRFEGVDMLRLPLDCGVTVIAAHMGLGRLIHKFAPWRNLSRNPRWFDPDYFRLLDMLRQHKNLYADISAILAPMRARALRHLSQQTDVHHKLLFGTDYPVPFTVRMNTHGLPGSRRRRISRIDNPFDRYATTMLEYFPEGNPVYDNYRKVLDQAPHAGRDTSLAE